MGDFNEFFGFLFFTMSFYDLCNNFILLGTKKIMNLLKKFLLRSLIKKRRKIYFIKQLRVLALFYTSSPLGATKRDNKRYGM